MNIIFKINYGGVCAAVSKATVKDMDALPVVARADLWRDVVYDAQQQYQRALDAMGADFMQTRERIEAERLANG